MLFCPVTPLTVNIAMTREELDELMTNPLEILLGGLTAASQLTSRFLLLIRRINLGQLTGDELTQQLFGVTSIGLDAITWLGGHQRRSDHAAFAAQLVYLTLERE